IRDLTVTGVQTCALPICRGGVKQAGLTDGTSARPARFTPPRPPRPASEPSGDDRVELRPSSPRATTLSGAPLRLPRRLDSRSGEIGRASCREGASDAAAG